MVHRIAVITVDTLIYHENGQEKRLAIETPEWYEWLTTATSFAFVSEQGSFTARKEQVRSKRGGWYWKAYRKQQGKLSRAYLDKSEELTRERLIAAAIILAANGIKQAEQRLGTRAQDSVGTTGALSAPLLWPDSPVPLTPLIGRDHEVDVISLRLQHPEVRLLTLTGPGGVGKTRIGLHIAAKMQDAFPDGVCFVSLAEINDPDLIIPTIAQTLGLIETGVQPFFELLTRSLRTKQALIFLDNFEQVVVGAPILTDLLAACPKLKLLVTSRVVLHVRGEQEYVVSPLALPDLSSLPTLSALVQYPAVALFLKCARATKADFQATEINAATIAEICVRLDGLPLAIELAAAHLKLLSASVLLTYLEHPLNILKGGSRDAPMRQQTLWHTLMWSYNLLTGEEQRLFCWLSVFVAGCSLEAAQFVCNHLALPLLEYVTSLINKSLLQQRVQENGEPRLFMLETIREFGLERLAAYGEREQARSAHAVYYLSLAEAAEPKLTGAEEGTWLRILDREQGNLRMAMVWALEQGNERAEMALRFGGALWRFWWARGHISEGRLFLSKVLSSDEQVKAAVRAKAYNGAAMLAFYQDDYTQAKKLCSQSLTLFRTLDDRLNIAATLNLLGQIAAWTSCYKEARTLEEEALTLLRMEGDKWGIASTLGMLASVTTIQGDYTKARTLAEEALALFRTSADTWGMGFALHHLARCRFLQGDEGAASMYAEESLALCRDIGDKGAVAYTLGLLGEITLFQQKIPVAQTYLQEALTLHKELEDHWGEVRICLLLAKMTLIQGNPLNAHASYLESLRVLTKGGDKLLVATCLEGISEARLVLEASAVSVAHLLAAATSLRKSIDAPLPPIERKTYERTMTVVRAKLGRDMLKRVWAEGEQMTTAQLITEIESELGQKEVSTFAYPFHTNTSRAFAGLTPREIDVLRLVAEGLTDVQIAEKLVLSSRTIGTHLRSIYNKLGVSSRAAATRFAVEHHLISSISLP